MTVCSECQSVEQGFHYADEDEDQENPICNECDMEDTRVFVDEDAGKDR